MDLNAEDMRLERMSVPESQAEYAGLRMHVRVAMRQRFARRHRLIRALAGETRPVLLGPAVFRMKGARHSASVDRDHMPPSLIP
jgi:hypothetical protein